MPYAAAIRDLRPNVTLIGAGAVARALGIRMVDREYPVLGVIGRSINTERLGREIQAPLVSDQMRDLPGQTRLVLMCVPDDVISELAEQLSTVPHEWEKTVVAHTSGALPASILKPLAEKGARVLSFHPLQTLTRESPPSALDGVYVGLEGRPQPVAAGIELATNLGMRYLVVTPETKPLYHLAASMASNYLVTLTSVVQQVLSTLDVDRASAQDIIEPLIRGTLDNLARSTPEDALTGPVVRGDLETLRQHGLALRRYLPHLVPVYAALAAETVPLAIRSSRLDPDRAREVLNLIEKMVSLPLPRSESPPPTSSAEAKT
jgi:predicted short-subunit dehydrogenase-like oxidoreductase (DUF2520 family)